MKKLFAFLLLILILLTACTQNTEPNLPDVPPSEESPEQGSNPQKEPEPEPKPEETNVYEIADGFIYLAKGHVIKGDVKYIDGKIFYRENQDGSRGKGKTGNVFSQDENIYPAEEKAYNVYANSPIHYYNGSIYCGTAEGIVKIDEVTGETETVFTFPKDKVYCASDAYKEYILYWEAKFEGAEDKKLYVFNAETGESKFLADINHSVHPFGGSSFRIKNGLLAYCQTIYSEEYGGEEGAEEMTYEFRVIDLKIGENELIYTSKLSPEKIAYNGEYLVWNEGAGLYYVRNNGKKTKIAEDVYDFDIVKDGLVAYSVGSGNVFIRDLAAGKELFRAKEEGTPHSFSPNFTVSEEGHFALICNFEEEWESEFFRDLYPDWDWNKDSEFAALPNAVVPIYSYRYPENNATAEEMFNFGEGVTAIKLDMLRGVFHIDCVLETEKYLLYMDGWQHKICDKETGKLLHAEDYRDFYTSNVSSLRTELCTEKEGFDYRILFTDRVIYRSLSDFAKSETVMLTEYIPENSEYYKVRNTQYDINKENTFVNVFDGSIVMKKEGEKPKVILEKSWFSSAYDFYKIAKGVPESRLEVSKDHRYIICFNIPRFACDGTKLIVSVGDGDDYNHNGTLVYDLEKEEIEYCFYGASLDIRENIYPIDDRYIQYRDIIWNAETGKSEKLPGKEFTVIPSSNRNLLISEEGKKIARSDTLYDFKGCIVDRETGEKFEFASTKDGGYPRRFGLTENCYIVEVKKGPSKNSEFYAIKFR